MSEDLEILEAIQGGDERAFMRWMARSELPIRHSLRSFATAVDTEVVVQETLLRIWQAAPRFVPDGRPDALLRCALRIARNLAIDAARRARSANLDPALLDNEPATPPPCPMATDEVRAAVAKCLEDLPDKPRKAIEARLRDALASDEAHATSVGMTVNTFFQNIRRARIALLDCLRERGLGTWIKA
ncbi:MAG: RNA polymerase sigma factor [Phycisphaerales bacterium]